MGAVLVLSANSLTVAAGQEVRFTASVKNSGFVVDEMTFEALGPLAPYTRITPERLSLFPGGEGEIVVTVAPPAGATVEAGTYDFALRVASKEFPTESAVDELTVEVLPFFEGGVELSPRTKNGRRSAKYALAFDNHSNANVQGSWRATQVDNKLKLSVRPQEFDAPPGSATFFSVEAKPFKRFWKGPDRPIPFAVEAVTKDGQKHRADGVFLQGALLPRWSWRVAALVAVGVVGVWAFSAFVARPAIRSEAKVAAKREVAPVNDDLLATRQAVALTAADTAQAAARVGGADAGGAGGAAGTVNISAGTVNIAAAAAPSAGAGAGAAPAAGARPGGAAPAAGAAPGAAAAPAAAAASPAAAGAGAVGAPTPGGGERTRVAPAAVFSQRFVPSAGPGATASEEAVVDTATMAVTDLFLQNPFDDAGILRVKRNDTVLLESNLANFRDLDHHFVTGSPFNANEKLVVEVECRNADRACRPSVYALGEKGGAGAGNVFSQRFVPAAGAGASASQEAVVDTPTLSVTDLFFQNPFDDAGILRVKRNGAVLIESNLANFRELEYHFVTGAPFKANERLVVEVECRNADRACRPAVYALGEKGGAGATGNVFSQRFVPAAGAGASASEESVVAGATMSVTDMFFQNPFNDTGVIRVKRGGAVIIETNLANFRDLEYHFVTGSPFNPNEKLIVEVECSNTDRACQPSVYILGVTG